MKGETDLGKLLLRVVMSGFMLTHGYPKLLKLLSTEGIKFADPLGIGDLPSLLLTVFAEFVCAILILIGFKTRWAVIPLIITMIVAAFVVHGADPIGKKELALLYAAGFATIGLIGPGKYSIDRS